MCVINKNEGKSFGTEILEGGWRTVEHERGTQKERNGKISVPNG